MPRTLSAPTARWFTASLFLCLASATTAQNPVVDPENATLDQVLDAYYQAIGGEAALAQIETVRVSGFLLDASGARMPYQIDYRPDRQQMRMDFALDGIPGTLAFDGEQGWQLPPLLIADEAIKLTAEDNTAARQQADFFGTLIMPDEKGILLELIGETGRDNTPAWEIKATRENGETERWFLNLETFLPFRVEARSAPSESETEQSSIVIYSDYRSVPVTGSNPAASLTWPFSVRVVFGRSGRQTRQTEKMQINVALEPENFAVPENAREAPAEPENPAPAD